MCWIESGFKENCSKCDFKDRCVVYDELSRIFEESCCVEKVRESD